MDLEKGDVYWCIASDDESNYRSPHVGLRKPHPVMVVAVEPNVKVSNFYGGEPDTDTNATTTFGPQADPAEYLFESEKSAWMDYAARLENKAELRRQQAEGLDERAENIRDGISEGFAPEYLSLLEMGSTPHHIERVREADAERIEEGEKSEPRPMNTFPHEIKETDE